VFVSDHDPNLKGNVAELKIAAEAARLGAGLKGSSASQHPDAAT
jgi:hypothetical protein